MHNPELAALDHAEQTAAIGRAFGAVAVAREAKDALGPVLKARMLEAVSSVFTAIVSVTVYRVGPPTRNSTVKKRASLNLAGVVA